MRRFFKWLVIVLIKPAILVWIIVNGIPPSIRAVGQAGTSIIKALDKK